MRKQHKQAGFTLIEVIAVLVILSILAAVAIPKFMDLQKEAKTKGLESLVAAAQGQLHMAYAEELLKQGGDTKKAWGAVQINKQKICNKVSRNGWLLDDTSLTCSQHQSINIDITATLKSNPKISAKGEFYDPDYTPNP